MSDERKSSRAMLDAWWAREPLCFEWVGHSDQHARFEYSSRGDRVEGWLHARSGAPQPLVLVVSESAQGAVAQACANDWSEAGAAVARLDLPLHGARESVKLSLALRDAASDLERLATDPDRERLVSEFLRQTSWDLRGALAGLGAEPAVDATRSACVGISLGALACAQTFAEAEWTTAVLAHAPRGGPPAFDAEEAAQRFAPRSALWVDPVGAHERRGGGERVESDSLDDLSRVAWPFLAGALGI